MMTKSQPTTKGAASSPPNQSRASTTEDAQSQSLPSPSTPSATAESQPSVDSITKTAAVDSLPFVFDPEPFDVLRILAEVFEDFLKTRIAVEHRIRGETVPEVYYKETLCGARAVESQAGSALRKHFKSIAPKIYKWAEETPGLGVHSMARLVGTTGHPGIAFSHQWRPIFDEGTGKKIGRELVENPPYLRTLPQWWVIRTITSTP